MSDQVIEEQRPPFWRDERFLQLLAQLLFATLIVAVSYVLYHNMVVSLELQGVSTSFRFLGQTASFDIGEQLSAKVLVSVFC